MFSSSINFHSRKVLVTLFRYILTVFQRVKHLLFFEYCPLLNTYPHLCLFLVKTLCIHLSSWLHLSLQHASTHLCKNSPYYFISSRSIAPHYKWQQALHQSRQTVTLYLIMTLSMALYLLLNYMPTSIAKNDTITFLGNSLLSSISMVDYSSFLIPIARCNCIKTTIHLSLVW